MDYDVLLIHPPAIYDFRKRAIFHGPIAMTVSESTSQFMTPPIGMLSIADYLDRNGFKALVDNVDERMITSESFNVANSYHQPVSQSICDRAALVRSFPGSDRNRQVVQKAASGSLCSSWRTYIHNF